MLSRNAQGLYWMGRYLERAEHLCRLLRLQVETLVDRPIREIHFGWSRIYASLGRQPPGGGLDAGASDDYTLADSYTLAGDLTFERTNPDSVRSCFAAGRENARQMRHCISAEMWTCLNLSWLRIRELDVEDVWKVSPESFYARTAQEIDTFIGVAEATMYRDEGWRFMRVGRFIERSQLLVALLLAQLATVRAQDEAVGADWTSLLRAYHAFDAYERSYSVEVRRNGSWTCWSPTPCCPARCAARSTRWHPGSRPSARARARAPAPRPGGSSAGCAPWSAPSGRAGRIGRPSSPRCERTAWSSTIS